MLEIMHPHSFENSQSVDPSIVQRTFSHVDDIVSTASMSVSSDPQHQCPKELPSRNSSQNFNKSEARSIGSSPALANQYLDWAADKGLKHCRVLPVNTRGWKTKKSEPNLRDLERLSASLPDRSEIFEACKVAVSGDYLAHSWERSW